MNTVDTLVDLFATRGRAQYGHEAISQTEHALQTASLAEVEAAPSPLVAAALLHDVGHLPHKLDAEVAGWTKDDRHEDIGWAYLRTRFAPAVFEPVRLHVNAKRYLCAIEPAYFALLSQASVRSLELQGGRYSLAAANEFRRTPFAADAVRLRRWDERAKVPGAPTKTIRDYAALLCSLNS